MKFIVFVIDTKNNLGSGNEMAAEGSKTSNRKVELRPFLG